MATEFTALEAERETDMGMDMERSDALRRAPGFVTIVAKSSIRSPALGVSFLNFESKLGG
jgi:hypothetical protein